MPPLERELILDNGMAFSHSSLLAIIERCKMNMETLTTHYCTDIFKTLLD